MYSNFTVKNAWCWGLLTYSLALGMTASFAHAAADMPSADDPRVKEHVARKASWIEEENTLRQG